MSTMVQRRLPIGAEFIPGGVHFRVWAPRREILEIVLENDRAILMGREEGGYFSAFAEGIAPGALYRFRCDRETALYPDPASRFQPSGPHGPSQIVDASAFLWSDQDWPGVQLIGQVIYEMHVGTFTKAGTWDAARERLSRLADLGITVIEVMPVAEFPGSFGWGYDGVDLFAPSRLYGSPEDFRAFVNEAHRLGMGVLLDVVYNHLGPDGNYLKEFSPSYVSKRYENEWGEAINFDGVDSQPVREFMTSNAAYWISEFHLDGLRLDATQQIFDSSKDHILAELARSARAVAAGRSILLIAEDESQQARLVRRPEAGGYGLDALWNDDFHHSARVAATGRAEAYYSDFTGSPQEFMSAFKWGFLYQGQFYTWQKKQRGTPALDLPPEAFVVYLENHDQVANSGRGERLYRVVNPGVYRALTGLLLLSPGTPMLFQGQEFGSSSPFLYFADHHPKLAALVAKGRREFLSQFQSIDQSFSGDELPAPHDPDTFEQCKLDHSEWERNEPIVRMHRDLLKLRREDPVISQQRTDWMHGAVLGPHAFALRFFGADGDHRLMVVNLGADLHMDSIAEPLLVAPEGTSWELLWYSESPKYGGCAGGPVNETNRWRIYSNSLALLKAAPRKSTTEHI